MALKQTAFGQSKSTCRTFLAGFRFFVEQIVRGRLAAHGTANPSQPQLDPEVARLMGYRLQPIAVNPDGVPYAYRIVDPRQFILSASSISEPCYAEERPQITRMRANFSAR